MADDRKGGSHRYHKKNPYHDRKEHKSDEIKKSLTHRARLRKNYFKLLDKEGIPVEKRNGSGVSEDDTEVGELGHRAREPRMEERRKPMNFAERAKIAKERKEATRKEKLQSIKAKRATMEHKSRERELKKERLSKKSRTGQPLMGPRINNLLDKIKNDMQ
ncbi:rRNA-processing protein FYV7 [[Candida] zeylanoides]|jgi:hypothetical protein